MDHTLKLPPLNIPDLLHKYGLKPNKRLGQNFLVDPVALERVVSAADLIEDDTVLEIGAGLGSLTRYLCLHADHVIAVELDEQLLPPLADVLSGFHNVEVIHGDMLKIDPSELLDHPGYKVVANIPYYITSKLIRHLLESEILPRRLVLTVQHEVAMRITAQPGDMNLLALSVQVYGLPQIRAKIPAGAFFPTPNVDSAVVSVDIYSKPVVSSQYLATLFQLAKAGFQHKRKMLRNALGAGLNLPGTTTEQLLNAAGIDPRRRAETLKISEWDKLAQVFVDNLQ